MTNAEKIEATGVRHSDFVIDSPFVIRHSPFCASGAFTLIELVVVFGLILVLSGLILSTVGYVRKKAGRARAEGEIAAMSAALENYKSDNATYAFDPAGSTNTLDARSNFDPSAAVYQNASLYLYKQLSGDTSANRNPTGKSYMNFKPKMLLPLDGSVPVTAIADPFGNSYGYSTAANPQANPTPAGTPGFNPTFDLWSTANYTALSSPSPAPSPQDFWIKNW